MKSRYLIALFIPFMFLGLTVGCDSPAPSPAETNGGAAAIPGATDEPEPSPDSSPDPSPDSSSDSSPGPDASKNAILPSLTPGAIQATITMEDGGIITVELYPDIAPQTVRNFVYLANQGFYDGLKFHRIISNFMIQGGCPNATGSGGPGYNILGEFSSNGIENNIRHERGVLSMARRGDSYNSAGSQFFIVHANSPHLNNEYAAFGRVLEGFDVVDAIAATPSEARTGSVEPTLMPVIKSITIDSDTDLPEPDKL